MVMQDLHHQQLGPSGAAQNLTSEGRHGYRELGVDCLFGLLKGSWDLVTRVNYN